MHPSQGHGGGGGGGAILIAASGTVLVTGTIQANGGAASSSGNTGSGGAIRIVATVIDGNGALNVNGGGGSASKGRIRLEAIELHRTAQTNPAYSASFPSQLFLSELPTLRIVEVGGMTALTTPTGYRDIVLPEGTVNPVTVVVNSSGILLGTAIKVTVVPQAGTPVSIQTDALSGTEADGSASASIELPGGVSTLSATVSFTVTASLGKDLSRFAQGEPVERVRIASTLQGGSNTTLITASGHEYTWPSPVVGVN